MLSSSSYICPFQFCILGQFSGQLSGQYLFLLNWAPDLGLEDDNDLNEKPRSSLEGAGDAPRPLPLTAEEEEEETQTTSTTIRPSLETSTTFFPIEKPSSSEESEVYQRPKSRLGLGLPPKDEEGYKLEIKIQGRNSIGNDFWLE